MKDQTLRRLLDGTVVASDAILPEEVEQRETDQWHRLRFQNRKPWEIKDKFGITPMDLDDLHVIAVISNPQRYRRRYDLYRRFEDHILKRFPHLWVVETAYGDRPFEITTPSNPYHIQFRTDTEIWHKENMINLAINRLPSSAKYVVWCDADILFQKQAIGQAIKQQLQHFDFVQCFSQAIDINHDDELQAVHNGFVWSYVQNMRKPPQGAGFGGYYATNPKQPFWHPGYVWAARIDAISKVGGLVDVAILGSADHHMAMGLIGQVERSIPDKLFKNTMGKKDPKVFGYRYYKEILEWQVLAERHISRNIGYVKGTIIHMHHGRKADRRYVERWQILYDNDFDPDTDIKRDRQGLWTLTGNKPRLRDDLRTYFECRNEDAVE